MFADLHTHTVCSDGSMTVEEILLYAKENNISYLSITDHDSVDAYDILKNQDIRNLFPGKIISGTELTAMYNGEIIEVLGFGFDTDVMADFIKNNVNAFVATLVEQTKYYVKAFKKYGVRLSPEFTDIITNHPEKLFEESAVYSLQHYLNDMRKFPENARFFESYEHMMTISIPDFARNYIYNPKSTLYVDLSEMFLSLDDAINAIHNAGGKAFLAHIHVYSKSIFNDIENIFKNHNLDGIEVSYPTFTKEQTENLLRFAKTNNLLVSGGSDFHGLDVKPNNFLSKGTDNNPIEISFVKDLIDKVNTI